MTYRKNAQYADGKNNYGGIVMSEFQFAMLQISLLGINLSILAASFIISTAINNLAKIIKEKNKDEQRR